MPVLGWVELSIGVLLDVFVRRVREWGARLGLGGSLSVRVIFVLLDWVVASASRMARSYAR